MSKIGEAMMKANQTTNPEQPAAEEKAEEPKDEGDGNIRDAEVK